ncbi:MAG TPA: ATP-binding cassette domain-containing protein, partial [Stellaceae bacterium]|nr:ATP-binding cassette domain-containing protein [Stellaceae bacterium]
MTTLLEIEGLAVDIPLATGTLHAVRDVSLGLERGETLCLVGESGSGKSLTALSIMGLLPRRAIRRARRLALLGEDLANAPERRMSELRGDRMAMVFQEPMTALNPAYTIGNQ